MTSLQAGTPRPADSLPPTDGTSATNAALLRIGALSGAVGFTAQVPLSFWHPHEVQPNDSVPAFHEYAASPDWVLIHLGQYLGALLVAVGLVALALSLVRERGSAGALAAVGTVTAVVTAAVFAVQMAVDGVALRSAVATWEQTGRQSALDVAIAVRSTEKGLSALFHLNNGITLLCLGLAIALAHRYPRWLGWVGAAAGVSVLLLATLTARTGFSEAAGSVGLPATALLAVFQIGTSVVMWRAAGARGPRTT